MLNQQQLLDQTTSQLNFDFLHHYPFKSARHLETIDAGDAVEILQAQEVFVARNLWHFLSAGSAEQIFSLLRTDYACQLLKSLDSHVAVTLLSRVTDDKLDVLLAALDVSESLLAKEFRELLEYPENTAARLMTTRVNTFYEDMEVAAVLAKLKQLKQVSPDVVYVLNNNQQLVGECTLAELIIAEPDDKLNILAKPISTVLSALDNKETVIEKFEGFRCNAIPVMDSHNQLIGLIRFFDVYETTKEDLASDMQTMVGASKEEKALSSSWFAVKKRLPWLQINLLTAFAASAVVGAFEDLIAQITALAILLPVAAGQSGNAGAQALAVTMRGLTLREITPRHWLKVMTKELLAGLLNGIAIAVTCSIAVYLWSGSVGLALVMAIAMVTSLAIACTAGAIVPIALKKFGMDPAQSSSIVLTTITDIVGFMSFLGIALLLSDMLPKG
ncbi:magnesium transporter [Paraglaciecola hydrolytica]|uniref:Magnesium transporter n=1 Tax=Paraglaciecola hydrolytica TaxID=1799789 RepID=A0A148KN63_9ALTE|nr:magnesium transporter [Paraglaciecola hydrolytica]KXI27754.1 magnesium transporter [Paraglaciecola hydrolytica]